MNPQIKDHFYDQFLKEPTKDNFRDFMKKSCGELNEMDFKEAWIDKGPLAKIMLAMANNGGGIIIFGVKENDDNTFDVLGLDNLKDTADISNSISRLVSSSLDYEVFNFVFDSDVYGEFENKNYQELDGNEHYQSWIDSGGLLPFPGGESREEFKRRNVTGFQKAVNGCLRNGISLAALVVHGGTIMNVMEEYADEDRSFYDWHVQNGKGYEVEIDPELWKKGRKFLHVIREL